MTTTSVLVDNRLKKRIGIPVQTRPAVNGERVPYLMLQPGVNRVSDADWAIVKEHADVKARIGKGTLVVVSAQFESIRQIVSADEAVEIIKRSTDLAVLKEWFEKDKRKVVRTAIVEQSKALATGEETVFLFDVMGW